MRKFSDTAEVAVSSRKQTLIEDIAKLQNKLADFNIDDPVISMIPIKMIVEDMQRLATAINTINQMDELHTEFTTNPIYNPVYRDYIPVVVPPMREPNTCC